MEIKFETVGDLMNWLEAMPKDAKLIISSAIIPNYEIAEIRGEETPYGDKVVKIFIH